MHAAGGDRWEQALELLTFSAVWRVQPSLVVVNSALDGMDRAGHWAQAANLLFGLSPATVSLDSLGLRSMMQAVEASGITGQTLGQIQKCCCTDAQHMSAYAASRDPLNPSASPKDAGVAGQD